jgi:hypothetical protein
MELDTIVRHDDAVKRIPAARADRLRTVDTIRLRPERCGLTAARSGSLPSLNQTSLSLVPIVAPWPSFRVKFDDRQRDTARPSIVMKGDGHRRTSDSFGR